MIRWIIRKFVKDYQNVENPAVRESYGVLAGVLGILCNVFLFALKMTIGLLTNSIAVTSDAFNNLTDTGSSIVAVLGAKLSSQPADDEHPNGHGRFEYIASLVVSFIIFAVGVSLLASSFRKLIAREEVLFSGVSTAVLAVSILVKVWMFSYNRYIGDVINSQLNRANAFDSLNDVAATGAVVVGTVLGRYTSLPVDGMLGLVISGLIIYTGFMTARESVNSLLGSSPDPELAEKISTMVLSRGSIKGTHDLQIHDYGPGRILASIHAEVSDSASVVDIHEEIDAIERLAASELGVNLVIHMDPIVSSSEPEDRPPR